MPACHGAAQLICGAWSGMMTPVKLFFLQNPQHAQHIHLAVVNERFLVVRHLVADVAQMDVAEFSLAAVSFHRVINVAVLHFGDGADAKFQRVARAGFQVNQLLVKLRLPDQPRLRADERQRRIVGMRGERDAGFFGDGNQFVEKKFQARPKLFVRRRRNVSRRGAFLS